MHCKRSIASGSRSTRARRRNGGGVSADPLSDLMFTMISIVLLALIVLLPRISPAEPRAATSRERELFDAYEIGGKTAVPLIASAAGVKLPGGRGTITIDDILSSPELGSFLSGLKTKDERVILAVDPRGSEAAFQLEAVLAARARQPILETRSSDACFAFANEALAKRSCAGAMESPQ
jgi:hypothetical protein